MHKKNIYLSVFIGMMFSSVACADMLSKKFQLKMYGTLGTVEFSLALEAPSDFFFGTCGVRSEICSSDDKEISSVDGIPGNFYCDFNQEVILEPEIEYEFWVRTDGVGDKLVINKISGESLMDFVAFEANWEREPIIPSGGEDTGG